MGLLGFAIQFEQGIPFWLGMFLAVLGVIVLGIGKSGFGGGVGIVAVPMFAIAFGAQRGTTILLPLLLVTDSLSVLHHWGTWDKKILRILTPGTLVGLFIGSVILWLILVGAIWPWQYDWAHWREAAGPTAEAVAKQKASAELLNLITGVICVGYVLLDQVRKRIAPTWVFEPNHKSGFVAGTGIGVISTLAHAAGPVAAIFLLNQGLPRAAFMGTTVIYFWGMNFVKLVPYNVIPGLMSWESAKVGACFVLLAPVGTWLGAWMCRHIPEKAFRITIMTVVFVTGLQLVVEYCTGVKFAAYVASVVTGH